MNFYEAQAGARRNTAWLVFLFMLAVAGLALAAVLVLLLALGVYRARRGGAIPGMDLALVLPVSAAVLLLVFLGTRYKLNQLAAGGRVVAESLGGVPLVRSSQDPLHRRVLNVVEEMALAAGIPVPAVYLLDEQGINAFAAGWTPRDAVVGVTRGAAEGLSRDELQGVVAHEFSHITGGDMARNLQLTGVLHGILLLGITGDYLLHAMRHGGRIGRGKAGAALGVAAFGLMAVGYVGTFFGNLIKAVISREREFHADASAVQYTRNPDGIAGALKKIGGSAAGSLLQSAAAAEFSHAYFSQGVKAGLESPLATHPPLQERVRRLDPDWDGRWLHLETPVRQEAPPPAPLRRPAAGGPATRSLGVSAALEALDAAGLVDTRSLGYARGLLGRLPAVLAGETRDPLGAQAVLLALGLDARPAERARQLGLVRGSGTDSLGDLVETLAPQVDGLAPDLHLPLVDLAMTSLRGLSRTQYLAFRATLLDMAQADNTVTMREWILQRVALYQLDGAHGLRRATPVRRGELAQAGEAARLLLATLAWLEHTEDGEAAQAFAAGCSGAGLSGPGIPERREPDGASLTAAMDRLVALGRPARIALMRGALACAALDGRLGSEGLALLRALAGGLELPMPAFTTEGT